MNCNHVRPQLSAYLDGELDAAQRAEVEAHLTTCPACARALADYRSLGQQIQALPDVAPPRTMPTSFTPPTRRESAFPNFVTRVLVNSGAAVVLVLVLIGLGLATSTVLKRMQVAGDAPQVVATYPVDGAADVPLDTNLTLTFGQAMDTGSVEAAMHIVPEVQLAYAWQGRRLTIVPFVDWQPATAYTLTIAGTAQAANGEPLVEPFVLRFQTVPPAESSREPLLNPIGRLGEVWRAEIGGPEGSLGYATAPAQSLWCASQRFEHGLMIWLDRLQADHVYVLVYGIHGANETGGDWQRYADTWREGDPESAGLTPPEGLFEPIRGFGRLWREGLGGPDASVGWAVEPERGFAGTVQSFEHGLMVWDPLDQVVYVLWDDGTWEAFPSSR